MNILKRNTITILLVIAVFGSGMALTFVSQYVYDTGRALSKTEQDITDLQWTIKSLKAEQAYLTRPERLEELANAMDHSRPPKTYAQAAAPVITAQPVAMILPPRKSAPPAPSRQPVTTENKSFSNLLSQIEGKAR